MGESGLTLSLKVKVLTRFFTLWAEAKDSFVSPVSCLLTRGWSQTKHAQNSFTLKCSDSMIQGGVCVCVCVCVCMRVCNLRFSYSWSLNESQFIVYRK